ncbi:5646_t:CDS:2 [Cetraspora pellucida]|uniref:5646_t:CDS:1 n=1 Tax=Cetraspora pellucida TaxID=1433469 RepID=A0A9N8Z6N0_9GLOM|nr:5646_t:CDS:2 [Cetraspora pellucida]
MNYQIDLKNKHSRSQDFIKRQVFKQVITRRMVICQLKKMIDKKRVVEPVRPK